MFTKSEGKETALTLEALGRVVGSLGESGGSNIVQQLSRGMTLDFEERYPNTFTKNLVRKSIDWGEGLKLTSLYSQEKLFEAYVNMANYHGAGILDGSRNIFGKELSELSLAESALLAIIPQAPNIHNMLNKGNFERWAADADGVLIRMEKNGFISPAERVAAEMEMYELIHVTGNGSDLAWLKERQELDGVNIDNYAATYEADPGRLNQETHIFKDFLEYLSEVGVITRDQAEIMRFEYYGNYGPMITDQPNDLKFLLDHGLEAKRDLVLEAMGEYQVLPIGDRVKGKEYVDFVDYLSQKYPNLMPDAEEERLREEFGQSNHVAWEPKVFHQDDQVLAALEYSEAHIAGVGLPTIGGYSQGNQFVGPRQTSSDEYQVSSPSAHRFEAISRDEAGKEKMMPVVGRDDQGRPIVRQTNSKQLLVMTELGFEHLDGEILQVSGEDKAQVVTPANGREGVLEIKDQVVDRAKLVVDGSGNYYEKDPTGREMRYLGRAYELDGSRILINLPELKDLSTTRDLSEAGFSSLLSGLVLSGEGHEIDRGKLVANNQGNNDPNQGWAKIEGLGEGRINPRGAEKALANVGVESTPIELAKGINNEGRDVLAKLVAETTTQNKPVLVWLNFDQKSEVVNVGTADKPVFEQVSQEERPVTAIRVIEQNGKEYVVYKDPLLGDYQMMETKEFYRLAAPVMGNRYKALVMGEVELGGEFANLAYDYQATSRQTEFALMSEKPIDWNNPKEREYWQEKLTINVPLQLQVEGWLKGLYGKGDAGDETVDWGLSLEGEQTNGAIVFAMDKLGNVILNVAVDGEGNLVGGNSAGTMDFIPGSVFKPVTASWFVKEGREHGKYYAGGKYEAGDYYRDEEAGFQINNWTLSRGLSAPGLMDLITALATSDNPYFFRLSYLAAKFLGPGESPKNLADFARTVGFGEARDIPGFPNKGGFLASSEWALAGGKMENGQARDLYPAESAMNAIGQGDLSVTLQQLVQFYGAIFDPQATIRAPNLIKGNVAEEQGNIGVEPKYLLPIQQGLHNVVSMHDESIDGKKVNGTAYYPFKDVQGYQVWGKTGTAETWDKSNSTFVGRAVNSRGEEIVIGAVFLNSGQEGSGIAAKFVRRAMDQFYKAKDLEAVGNLVESASVEQTKPTDSLLGDIKSQVGGGEVVIRENNLDRLQTLDQVNQFGEAYAWDQRPSADFIRFNFDLQSIINDFQNPQLITAEQHNQVYFGNYLKEQLKVRGYGSLLSDKRFTQALQFLVREFNNDEEAQCVPWTNLTSAFALVSNYQGLVPPLLSGVDGGAEEHYDKLILKKSGSLSGFGYFDAENNFHNSKVIKPSALSDLAAGDIVYMPGHVIGILDGYVDETGDPWVLVSHANRGVGEDGITMKTDGEARVLWMNTQMFQDQFAYPINSGKFVALRTVN